MENNNQDFGSKNMIKKKISKLADEIGIPKKTLYKMLALPKLKQHLHLIEKIYDLLSHNDFHSHEEMSNIVLAEKYLTFIKKIQ